MLLGISSFELNDAKHVGGIAGDESNPCFKKHMGEHQHPVPAKVSKSWWSKESLPKGLMFSLWRHGGLFPKSIYGSPYPSPRAAPILRCAFACAVGRGRRNLKLEAEPVVPWASSWHC